MRAFDLGSIQAAHVLRALDGYADANEFGVGVSMVGAILVFLGVCAIVAVYMYIVHRFLSASAVEEEPMALSGKERAGNPSGGVPLHAAPREEQWAH